jgi:hypothetical protein
MVGEKIRQSDWWTKATAYHDRHYEVSDGIMLSDHLNAVAQCIEKIFDSNTPFHSSLLAVVDKFGLDRQQVKHELEIVALLHDIGKTEDDKKLQVEHPLKKVMVPKRHPIVGMLAAIELLNDDPLLTETGKLRIYHLVEEHDSPYAFYRQFETTGTIPKFKSWKKLNDKIDEREGVGLLYLLIFKLADIDGHEKVEDVMWFFRKAKKNYYNELDIELPVPEEGDIR